jgi:hypothetical protein
VNVYTISYSSTLNHNHTLSHTHRDTLSLSYSHTYIYIPSPSLTRTHKHINTHTHRHTHTQTHLHRPTRWCFPSEHSWAEPCATFRRTLSPSTAPFGRRRRKIPVCVGVYWCVCDGIKCVCERECSVSVRNILLEYTRHYTLCTTHTDSYIYTLQYTHCTAHTWLCDFPSWSYTRAS